MEFFILLLKGISLIVIIDAVASWFARPDGFPRNITGPITEPLYRPIRALINPQQLGGLDISPLVVLLGLRAVEYLVVSNFSALT